MDFMEGLPKSNKFSVILVVVDRLSKFQCDFGSFGPTFQVHPFPPLETFLHSQECAAIFSKEVMSLHGTPRSIVSDRDKVFISKFWQEFFRLHGTSLNIRSAYHPQRWTKGGR